MPYSGPAAGWGIPFTRGVELEIEKVNSEGGIKVGGVNYLLEPIREDNFFTTDGAKTAAEKLIYKHEVKIIFGSVATHDSWGVQLATTPNKVINDTASWHKKVLKPEDEPCAPYAFKSLPTTIETVPGVWSYIKAKHPEVQRIALIGPDTESSCWAEPINRDYLESVGYDVVFLEYFEFGMTDFYPILTRLLATNPDAIQSSSAGVSDWGLILKQARELGYDGISVQDCPIAGDDLFGISGLEAAEGFIAYDYLHYGPSSTPEYRDFHKRFVDKYGMWAGLCPCFVTFFYPLIQAMEQTGTVDDTDILVEALETGTFDVFGLETVFGGEALYGRPRMMMQPLGITEVVNGKQVMVGIISVEDQLYGWPSSLIPNLDWY